MRDVGGEHQNEEKTHLELWNNQWDVERKEVETDDGGWKNVAPKTKKQQDKMR